MQQERPSSSSELSEIFPNLGYWVTSLSAGGRRKTGERRGNKDREIKITECKVEEQQGKKTDKVQSNKQNNNIVKRGIKRDYCFFPLHILWKCILNCQKTFFSHISQLCCI